MIITDIIEISKKQCKIMIDQEFAFVLYKGELHLYGIKKDAKITEETYHKILDEVLVKRCKLRAMNLLMARPYTEKKLRDKLMTGYYPDSCIHQTIEYVKSYHYVDDEQFARDYIFYRFEKMSYRQIVQKLRLKGVSEDVIKRVYEEYCEQENKPDEKRMIREVLRKKQYLGYTNSDDKTRLKLIRHLLQKGFQYDDILSEMRNYSTEP